MVSITALTSATSEQLVQGLTPDDSARRPAPPCFQIGRRSGEDPHRRRIDQIEESKMKSEVEEEGQVADGTVVEEVQPVVRGFVKDWDAMETCSAMSATGTSGGRWGTRARSSSPSRSSRPR
jgi:hypothetical protein